MRADAAQGLRNALWIGHLVKSCLRGGESAEETTGNVDEELDMLLAGMSPAFQYSKTKN